MTLDSHTHAWGAPSEAHPWVNGPLVETHLDGFTVDTAYTAEKLLADMDATGIEEAVVVGYPVVEWTDNWYTERAAADSDRLYGIVILDQFADGAADALREAMSVDGVLGFRLGAACPYDRMWETFDPSTTWLRDAIQEAAFWDAAGAIDATVQILAHHEQLDQVADLVETRPGLTYLLDHFSHAGPDTEPGEVYADLEPLADHEGFLDFPIGPGQRYVAWTVFTVPEGTTGTLIYDQSATNATVAVEFERSSTLPAEVTER